MKKFRLAAILLCCVLLAGCGNEEPETVVFYDIETEEEELGFVKERGDSVLGLQFLQGEPVMLVENKINFDAASDIYLCRTDGSRELLVQGAVRGNVSSSWYIDNEEAVYRVDTEFGKNDILVKFDPKGKEIYRTDLGADLADICQAADGRIYLLLQKNRDSSKWLEVLDAASGKTVRAGGDLELHTDTKYLGMGLEALFSMRGSSQPVFMKVDLKEKGMAWIPS